MPKSTPLMWDILDPDTDVTHTLFASFEALTPKQVGIHAAMISMNPRFQEASMLFIERAHFHQPPQKPKSELKLSRSTSAFFDKKQDAIIVDCQKSLTLTLAEIAKASNKPTYPLESEDDTKQQFRQTRGDIFTEPSNMMKLIAFVGLFPVAYHFYGKPHRDKMRRETETFQRLYLKEDLEPALKKLKDNPEVDRHLNRDRSFDWLYQGYQGQPDFTFTKAQIPPNYKKGLVDLLHASEFKSQKHGAFIVVSAEHVFDKEQGLLQALQNSGFTCTPVDKWKTSGKIEKTPRHGSDQIAIRL